MDQYLGSYFIGIFIVFFSHIYTLSKAGINGSMMSIHSIANLIAAALIAYYFTNKEMLFK